MCTRAPPEHLSSPPKYAFRPKDPHFEIDPHDFPAIYASNIRNLDSFRLFSPRASTLASSIASNRTGSPRNATREFLESGLGATSTRGQRRGKEKLAYLLFLLFFSPPPFSIAIVFLFLSPTFRRVSIYRVIDTVRSKFRSVSPFFFLLFCARS